MYGYKKDNQITGKQFMLKYGDENIFELVFGEKPKLNKYYKSPFRDDCQAGTWFNMWNQQMIYVDYGDVRTHRYSIQAVMDFYNLSYPQALEFIEDKLKGLSSISINQPLITPKTKIQTDIHIYPGIFDIYHKEYWSSYEINKDQLIEDNIFPVKAFRVNNNTITPLKEEVTYSISEWDDATKICRALHKGNYKWVSTTTKNHIGNLANLDFAGETLTITKSYKDCRVLMNQGLQNVIWFQNENMMPDKGILNPIVMTFDKVNIIYDNDTPGILGAKKLQNYLENFHNDVNTIILPTEEKDSADIVKRYGSKKLNEIINYYKLR